MLIWLFAVLILSILAKGYIIRYRYNSIKTLGKSRVTWTSHKPFKIKDSLYFSFDSGIKIEPRPSRDTYLVETSDNIEQVEVTRTTSRGIDGSFTTSISDEEGVDKCMMKKYIGKQGIVNNVYIDQTTMLGSDHKSTLENEINNETLILIFILNYTLVLSAIYFNICINDGY